MQAEANSEHPQHHHDFNRLRVACRACRAKIIAGGCPMPSAEDIAAADAADDDDAFVLAELRWDHISRLQDRDFGHAM